MSDDGSASTQTKADRSRNVLLYVAVIVMIITAMCSGVTETRLGPDYAPGPPMPGDVVRIHNIAVDAPPTGYACPQKDCMATVVAAETEFTVDAIATGQIINGDDTWVGWFRNGAVTYFPASSISVTKGANQLSKTSIGTIVVIFLAAMLGIIALVRARTFRTRASRTGDGVEALLVSGTSSAGVVFIVAAMLLNRGNKSVEELLSDSLVNLGAGFVGAAVTFVLFESLLAGRTVGPESIEQVSGRVERLQAELGQQIAVIESKIDGLTGNTVEIPSSRFDPVAWLRRLLR